jgi:hypothetical protein
MSSNSGTRATSQRLVVERAQSDPNFRTRLLDNARDALQEQFGISVPAGINVRVIEEGPDEVVLVLPARLGQPDGTLSDEDLEAVAGGTYDTYSFYGGGGCVC